MSNISFYPLMYSGNDHNHRIEDHIGEGKILILFICHSGRQRGEPFRNSIRSLVTYYLSRKYSAVIAPCWALDVRVPRYWLPEFLSCLEEGLFLDDAVFKANKKVYEIFPHPAAWACLHLYGDPTFHLIK